MTTALVEQPKALTAPAVTAGQLELVKRTVANGATADELKLYLYDCARQGVHPLDKLIHFTVRKNQKGERKYTPITSIDFMRIRAADTGEYAGSDDATFRGVKAGDDFEATVTVWRMVDHQRCPFTATARWTEYKPDKDDFMWRKMPHTMLAKCAEALALRKGFPKQLAGLYAKEEMDQAGPSEPTVVTVETVPTQPDGYADWRLNLTATADNGRDALNAMWAASKPEYRDYLRKAEPNAITALSERAKKAKPVEVSA